jgi:hypothetical protein
MYGAIGSKWTATGGSKSSLGNPVSRQSGGLKSGGAVQYFHRGAIVWSPATGAKISKGGIRAAWVKTGATNGKLGYPKTDEYSISGGVRQNYQGGYITWNRNTQKTAVAYTAPAKAVSRPAPKVNNTPAGAKAFAKTYLKSIGWGDAQHKCLVTLWDHESGWKFNIANPYSGSYGIPQALPGNKMASAGADWRTNSQTQIKWGVSYIKSRYGTPCGAYNAWRIKGWY